MATKTKVNPLSGMHTAGIFSDMSVDGPQIGTLVVVVDRGKNLPNRKTIGKQDPYCAARLGKEAKKTNTDIRGGQTPKWDQELRFIVHDSPDYFQLKVSVFNDDKKTELIGEAWIDLRDIVIPGGGQSDQWHQLACKGKYAGEVRIEITFYDSRPKPEKPAVKAKPPLTAEPETAAPVVPASTSATGPRSMPKRRPLPSDPVTGEAPPSPTPEAVETPPRPQPNPPSSIAQSHSPIHQPDYNTPPPAPPAGQGRYQEPADHYSPRAPSGDFGTPSRRADCSGQPYRTPDRQDPYQSHPDDRNYSPHYQQPTHDRYDPRLSQEQYDFPQLEHQRARSFEEDRPPPPPAHRSRTGSNPSMNSAYQNGTSTTMRHDVLRNEAQRQSATASYPGRPTYKAYDSAPAAPIASQYSNLDHPSPPRHHSYDANFDQSYRPPMQATVEDVPESPDSVNNSWRGRRSHIPQSRSQAQLEAEYDMGMGASPAPLNLSGRGGGAADRYSQAPNMQDQHRRHDSNGYAPLHTRMVTPRVSGQSSRHFGRHSETSLVAYGNHPDQQVGAYRSELDDTSAYGAMPMVPASLVPGMDSSLTREISEQLNQERNRRRRYTQPAPVDTPPRGRIMSDASRRYEHTPPSAYNSGPPSHTRGQISYPGPSTSSVNVVIKQRNYSPNPPRDPSPNPQHTIRRKSVSPAPPPSSNEPRRLSGVPFGPDSYDALNPSASAAGIREPGTARPDYDELSGKIITHDGREVDPSDHLPMETWAPEPEPKKASNPSSASTSSRPSPAGAQPPPSSGRRALRLAGRPQSMLPGSGIIYSGGPEPAEPATPSPPASGGRNRLQKKMHRSSMATGPVMSGANGFSRSGGSDVGSSPLAPLAPHQDNFTPSRQLTRASTYDYAGPGSSENRAPVLYNGGYNNNGYSPTPQGRGAPTIPAKVPLALPPPSGPVMSGALQLHSSSLAKRGGLDDWEYDDRGRERDMWSGGGGNSTLEEELSRIDIGTGRSRRRDGY